MIGHTSDVFGYSLWRPQWFLGHIIDLQYTYHNWLTLVLHPWIVITTCILFKQEFNLIDICHNYDTQSTISYTNL